MLQTASHVDIRYNRKFPASSEYKCGAARSRAVCMIRKGFGMSRRGMDRLAGTTQRPPGPKGRPLIGNLLRCIADPLGLVNEAALGHGDVILLVNRPVKVYLINHPEYIRDILVTHNQDFALGPIRRSMKMALGEGLLTSEGDIHLNQRRLIQPVFHKQHIEAYGTVMVEQTSQHTARWQNGIVVDVSQEMSKLTLRVVIKALFNSEVPATVRHLGDATTFMNKYISARGRNPLGPILHKLPLPFNRRFRRAKAWVDGIIYDLIREREDSGTDNGDLLSMLIAAGETGNAPGSMSHRQVKDEAITLIAAGHETMANALTWIWYLLVSWFGCVTITSLRVDQGAADRCLRGHVRPSESEGRRTLSELEPEQLPGPAKPASCKDGPVIRRRCSWIRKGST